MKKFIAIMVGLVVALGGAFYAYFYAGFYIDFHPNKPIEARFTCDSDTFYVENNGEKKALAVKGVVLESAAPGQYFSDYKNNEETYLSYLEKIGQMGANTVRVKTIMNPAFYKALLSYNTAHERPLYLLQGVGVEDYDQNNGESYYGNQFISKLIGVCKTAVDVIHGQAAIADNRINGSGFFRADVSDYCLGFLLGDYWIDSTIAYTNNSQSQRDSYEGTYFSTAPGARDFECIMAEVMDKMTVYESNKYKTQRLISFVNGPSTDPFDYLYNVRIQVDKVVAVDYENVIAKPALLSGYFAAYNMYSYISSFTECLEGTTKEKLASFLDSDKFDPTSIYDGYIQVLNYYHSMPVLIASYGYSSARGGERSSQGAYGVNLTEEQQGELLVSSYQDMMNTGCTGAVISSFQDNWSIVSWNTQYATDENYEKDWCDVQMPDNCYGLLAFDPGKERPACYVDGDFSEWNASHLLAENGGLKLYYQYDSSYLYFYIEGASLDSGASYVIPIDITPNSGSHFDAARKLEFDRETDFLVQINGRYNSGVYVQEYYNSNLMEFGEEINLINRFYQVPSKNSPLFEPITFILKKDFDPEIDVSKMTPEERKRNALYKTFETGKFTYGNSNPQASDFNSLADFCQGELGGVEVRIPWQLLNVSDPTHMTIHDDYYKNYGVEELRIGEMHAGIGLAGAQEAVAMKAAPLAGTGKPEWHERLKKSYYIVSEAWNR